MTEHLNLCLKSSADVLARAERANLRECEAGNPLKPVAEAGVDLAGAGTYLRLGLVELRALVAHQAARIERLEDAVRELAAAAAEERPCPACDAVLLADCDATAGAA